MKLETINKFLRPLGFVLIVEVGYKPVHDDPSGLLFEQTDSPTKIYFMFWKDYLKKGSKVLNKRDSL